VGFCKRLTFRIRILVGSRFTWIRTVDLEIRIRNPDPEPRGLKWLPKRKNIVGKQLQYFWRARLPKVEGHERSEITQNRIF
jgi:hypothetical protein